MTHQRVEPKEKIKRGQIKLTEAAVSIESVADILDRELQALIEEWIT